MAFTSTLILTLFLFFIPVREVTCSNLLHSTVSSTGVQLSWKREGAWAIVGMYRVSVRWGSIPVCNQVYVCFKDSCSFDSDTCFIKAQPCSVLRATVEGGGYREDAEVTTAPAPVTNITVQSGTGKRTVSWVKPKSKCLQKFTARVDFNYYNYQENVSLSDASITVHTCTKGEGTVEVKAVGGSGESEGVKAEIEGAWRDAVDIPECSPAGCRSLTVNWKYKIVCPETSYIQIRLTDTDVYTNINVLHSGDKQGEITYQNLQLDSKFHTCIMAVSEDGKRLATKCTYCEVEPEAVRYLRVTGVTNYTASLAWQPPKCPKPLTTSYEVYYDHKQPNITSGTSVTIGGLKDDNQYDMCVRVHHTFPMSGRTTTCIPVSTLPAALKYVRAKVYQGNSLFVTWPSDPRVNKYKYRVSWKDRTTDHVDYTEYSSYTIEGYNTTLGPDGVCVEVEVAEDGRRGVETCIERPYPNFHPDKPDKTNMIVSVCVSAVTAIVLSAVLVVVAVKEAKSNKE